MFDLFSQGGPVFMGILTLILLSLIIVFVMSLSKRGDEKQLNQSMQWLKSIGTLGLVVGILGQLIGLFTAFSVLETVEGISSEMLAGGLKVSMITTLYGLLIYIVHLVCSMVLRRWQPAA
ncbi:MAG: MotA/TolQ/ExbB proton channel family protein [Cryomorphaceae bacterium]